MPLLYGRTMEIFPEVGHNKLFFILARKLLNFIAILLDLNSCEVRACLEISNIFQSRRRDPRFFRRNRECRNKRSVFAN